MLDSNVKQLLNEQVNKEFYSAYLYLDFSNFYKSKGLDGFANWYNVQAQEERDHALLFMQYLQNNNVRVTLDSHIRTALRSTDFLNPHCATVPVPDSPCILEVKWDNYLPDAIRDMVQLGDRCSSAYSKYAACRMYD